MALGRVGGVYTTSNLLPDYVGRHWADGVTVYSGFTTILPPNAPSCISGAWDGNPVLMTVSSSHPGGVNACMTDGSVRFIDETIDTGNLSASEVVTGQSPYGVWGSLGSKAGGEVISNL